MPGFKVGTQHSKKNQQNLYPFYGAQAFLEVMLV